MFLCPFSPPEKGLSNCFCQPVWFVDYILDNPSFVIIWSYLKSCNWIMISKRCFIPKNGKKISANFYKAFYSFSFNKLNWYCRHFCLAEHPPVCILILNSIFDIVIGLNISGVVYYVAYGKRYNNIDPAQQVNRTRQKVEPWPLQDHQTQTEVKRKNLPSPQNTFPTCAIKLQM